MDYEKKYNEALKRAKAAIDMAADKDLVKGVATTIFPQLRESEDFDEKVRKWLVDYFSSIKDTVWIHRNTITCEQILAWLEKQKEPENASASTIIPSCWAEEPSLQKEQKPISTEDMPYVADEHFFERESADSFKYKLAEYMTKCCTKKEGPYGYEYGISAESILKMAKEELIKRGELKEQKPAWSEEDEEALDMCLDVIPKKWKTKSGILLTKWLKDNIHLQHKQDWSEKDEKIWKDIFELCNRFGYDDACRLLRSSLRPSWKPSEEQMEALAYAIQILDDGLSPKAAKAGEELEHLREQLKKL